MLAADQQRFDMAEIPQVDVIRLIVGIPGECMHAQPLLEYI